MKLFPKKADLPSASCLAPDRRVGGGILADIPHRKNLGDSAPASADMFR